MPSASVYPLTARPLPVRAVLFDLDGTLADTYEDLGAALNRVRADLGMPPVPLVTLRPHASHGARGLLGAGCSVFPGDERFEPLRLAFLAHYEQCLCEASRLFEGVAELLAAIEERGLAWGIVTNKQTRFTEPLVSWLELAPRARAVICGDTTPHAKPHPAPLLAGARALGLPPEACVYVGDAERDMQAGVAAGMPTLLAAYGYIAEEEPAHTWPAAGRIDTPLELLRWLP
jgi:phosphoglycolate phosphatase